MHIAFKVDALTRHDLTSPEIRRTRLSKIDMLIFGELRASLGTRHVGVSQTWPLESISFLWFSFYNQVLFLILGSRSLRRSPFLFEK